MSVLKYSLLVISILMVVSSASAYDLLWSYVQSGSGHAATPNSWGMLIGVKNISTAAANVTHSEFYWPHENVVTWDPDLGESGTVSGDIHKAYNDATVIGTYTMEWNNESTQMVFDVDYTWDIGSLTGQRVIQLDGTAEKICGASCTWLAHGSSTTVPNDPNALIWATGSFGYGMNATHMSFGGTNYVPLVADFNATPTNLLIGMDAQFQNLTTYNGGSPTTLDWYKNDTWFSSASSPLLNFPSAGNFSIQLYACDSGGCDWENKTDYIHVYDQPILANFSWTLESPLHIHFTDTSLGTITSWFWEFGDGENSTSQNPEHTFPIGTIYDVELAAMDGELVDTVIHQVDLTGNTTKHLLLDIKDINENPIYNANVGIKEYIHNTWRNSTSSNYATGFLNAGPNHEYPLQLGQQYTLAASKSGFISNSTTITFSQDYQLVTLNLMNESLNYTPEQVKHLDLNVYEASTLSGFYKPDIQIYFTKYDEWWNTSCDNTVGNCGWIRAGEDGQRTLEYDEVYTICSSKEYYNQSCKEITFTTDHQLEKLYLRKQQGEFNLSLAIDIKYVNNSYVEGADYGIYDYTYGCWRNATCLYGACGFHGVCADNKPLKLPNQYLIVASKSGFQEASKYIWFSYDTQLFTLYLRESTIFTGASWTPMVRPTTLVPYVTITGNISKNETSIPYPTIQPFPTLNDGELISTIRDGNSTVIKEELLNSGVPAVDVWIGLWDWIIAPTNNMFIGLLTAISYPFLFIIRGWNYVFGLNQGLLYGLAETTTLISYSAGQFVESLPAIIVNVITLMLSFDIVRKVWLIQKEIFKLGGS